MKKIAYIVMAGILTAGIAGCSSDDLVGSGNYQSSVSVVKQNVCFDAPASEGTIEFTAPSAATVSTTAEWCQATLSGNTVNVSVPQNNRYESRACDVIIKCGADSARVNVVQNGFIFQLSAGTSIKTNTDKAQTLSYDFKSNLSFVFRTSADWVVVTNSEGQLHVTLKENTTGHIRKSWLYFESDNIKDSLSVTQYDFDKDIAGEGYLAYYNASGEEKFTKVEITDSCLYLPGYAKYGDWRIPFTFDADKMNFNFTNAQCVGTYNNTYYVADCMFNSTYGYVTYYQSCSWDAPIEYYDEAGCMEADMTDNGSWTYPFEGFYLRAFTSTTFSSKTNKGSLVTFIAPAILRFDPTSGAKGQMPTRFANAQEVTAEDFAQMLGE